MIFERETIPDPYAGRFLFGLSVAVTAFVQFALFRTNDHVRPLFSDSTLILDHRPGSLLEQNINTEV